MKLYGTRRDFLTGAAACFAPISGSRKLRKTTAPLPRPKFYWGVGIENCWIAQADPARDGNRRLLDVFLQMQHYDRWKEGLDLLPETGVNCIRYSVPWYKAEPKPGVYDWSWIDKPIEYLTDELKIIPIMDPVHYGTPAWMADGIIDDRFPDAVGAYAGAIAAHFKGLVNHYSPHNEPGLTCFLCGLVGRWPPYQKGAESWARVGVQAARSMIHEMAAIRENLTDAVIISVDPFLYKVNDKFLLAREQDSPRFPELRRAAAAYPASLAYGKVTAAHPLGEFLQKHGIKESDIDWFRSLMAKPDILGFNYYPDLEDFSQDGDFTRKGALPLEQAARDAVGYVRKGLLDAQSYFGLPVYLSETSAGLTDQAKIAYMEALHEMALDLRWQNFPLVGINWWPLYETIQWDYRENVDKPLGDFIYPGGWNNGIYLTKQQPDGSLPRIPTPAAPAFRRVIQRDAVLLLPPQSHEKSGDPRPK